MLDLRHLDLIVNQVQGNVCLTNMPDPRHLNLHYQKFAKYQRLYRRHISVGNLRSELPTDTFSSVIQSVTTDGKVFELKKRRVADVEVLAGHFFRRHHRRIQKWQPVQWRDRCTVYITDGLTEGFEMADPYGDVSMFPSESQTWSPTEYPSVNPSRKVNIWQLWRPTPPLFLLLLSNPNSPHLQTTSPPPPKKKSSSYQHNKLYFLKFCGHSIRVLIYRRILSIFVSNSFFLNFNI